MPIKLAFSTTACPEWTIEDAARKAQEMGYQGVELRTLGGGSTSLACDPALSDPDKIRKAFNAFGVEPVCLSTSVAFNHRDDSDTRAAVRHADVVVVVREAGVKVVDGVEAERSRAA